MRFYDEEHHREAIRTRPMLSVLHEKDDLIAQAVTQISRELHQIRAITERLSVNHSRNAESNPAPSN